MSYEARVPDILDLNVYDFPLFHVKSMESHAGGYKNRKKLFLNRSNQTCMTFIVSAFLAHSFCSHQTSYYSEASPRVKIDFFNYDTSGCTAENSDMRAHKMT